ncbi:MAG TPA: hypothetical protein VGC47_01225 [Acidimicrobiia bacterium]
MGQQPNIELEMSDLPRPKPARAPERRWAPTRPGELTSPADVPWGGVFGTTGPDPGYALLLASAADIDVEGLDRHVVDEVVAAVAAARASLFGRAPMSEDIELAHTIFGFRQEGLPKEVLAGLESDRATWLAGAGHDRAKVRDIVASVPRDVLQGTLDELRSRMIGGRRGIDR